MIARLGPLAAGLAALFFSAPACAGYLTYMQVRFCADNRPDYEWAACRAGVPWQAIAAIHYREKTFLREATNWGGPMMMDMGGQGRAEFITRIRAEEKRVARKYCLWTSPRVRDDFRFACLCQADELRNKVRGRLWLRNGRVDEAILADALWGVNGRAAWHRTWKRSAYVNNDPAHGRQLTFKWRHKVNEIWYFKDTRPGALVVYRELKRIERDCSTMLR